MIMGSSITFQPMVLDTIAFKIVQKMGLNITQYKDCYKYLYPLYSDEGYFIRFIGLQCFVCGTTILWSYKIPTNKIRTQKLV